MKNKIYIDNALREYRYSCQKLANEFRDKYFSKNTEIDFVSDDVTNVAIIGDYYFSIDVIYQYLLHKYTKEQIFKRYNAELDNSMLKKPLPFENIKHWKQLQKFANKNKLK